ncbi:acyl-CoA thioesterase [Nocardia aurea]|uniref:acyl-CoA thioesterase n=1 Tax=Nocardia aurea TaxID=2144174 RepID=UPI000D6862C4|nr:thioesterase family protein [Nocardia aurea]
MATTPAGELFEPPEPPGEPPGVPEPSEASEPSELSGLPEVTIERAVEWHDTDAAGHQHHSAILRWVESAEAELLRGLGLSWLFGRTPRIRHEVGYHARLWFGETVRIRLRVQSVGRTSLRYAFEVHGGAGVAADGVVIIAHAEPHAMSATPWPSEVRARLSAAEGRTA